MSENDNEPTMEQHIKSRRTWTRFIYMILFAIVYSVAGFVLTAVVVIQFLLTLFTGEPNPNLKTLGQGLATFCYDIIQFLCYNSERHPWPFSPWRAGPPQEEAGSGEG